MEKGTNTNIKNMQASLGRDLESNTQIFSVLYIFLSRIAKPLFALYETKTISFFIAIRNWRSGVVVQQPLHSLWS